MQVDGPLLALLVACSFAVLVTAAVVLENLFSQRTDPVLLDMFRLAVGGALAAIMAYRAYESSKKG